MDSINHHKANRTINSYDVRHNNFMRFSCVYEECTTTQYSPKQFFRRIPNTKLEDYFESKHINLGVDFGKLEEKDSEIILDSFLELSEEQKASTEADFQD